MAGSPFDVGKRPESYGLPRPILEAALELETFASEIPGPGKIVLHYRNVDLAIEHAGHSALVTEGAKVEHATLEDLRAMFELADDEHEPAVRQESSSMHPGSRRILRSAGALRASGDLRKGRGRPRTARAGA